MLIAITAFKRNHVCLFIQPGIAYYTLEFMSSVMIFRQYNKNFRMQSRAKFSAFVFGAVKKKNTKKS